MQSGNFPLRGRKKEEVALDFWKQIKKEMHYAMEIEQVLADGEDITQLVKELKEQRLYEVMNDDLPF